MRKHLFWLLLAFLLLSFGIFGVVWRWTPSPYGYDRIQLGMNPAEVQEVLGVPPGDYDKKHVFKSLSMGPHGSHVRERGLPSSFLPDANGRPAAGYTDVLTMERWIWEDYWIWVAYDANGRVVGCYLLEEWEHEQQHPSFMMRLRAFIRSLT